MKGGIRVLLSLATVLFWSNFSTAATVKSFQRVLAPNGIEVCALESPTVIYKVDDWELPWLSTSCTCPSMALCSWKCSLEPNCTAFNWKSVIRECELYFFVPAACKATPYCEHYGSKICRSCSGKVLNLNGDNLIESVFINGCESDNLPNAAEISKADSVALPLMVDLIAAKVNNLDGVGGLLGSTDGTLRTDGTWKVSTNYIPGWMDVNYDDSEWENATTVASNDGLSYWPVIPGIDRQSFWITSSRTSNQEFYFRYRFKRGKKSPPIEIVLYFTEAYRSCKHMAAC